MPDEIVKIFYERSKTVRVIAGGCRPSVAAGIPGKHGEVWQVEFLCDVLHASGVLVSAMQKDDRRANRRVHGGPIAVEQPGPAAGFEMALMQCACSCRKCHRLLREA